MVGATEVEQKCVGAKYDNPRRLIHTFVPHIGLLVTRMLFCSTNGPINKEQNFATSSIAKANLGVYTI